MLLAGEQGIHLDKTNNNMLSIVPRQLVLKIPVKLIIFNTFAHEILLVDAVKASRTLFMKN